MAYLLFIDESGSDHHESPYEVLAGLAVEDSSAWSLITAVQKTEEELFGRRISAGSSELKGKELLKKKTSGSPVRCHRSRLLSVANLRQPYSMKETVPRWRVGQPGLPNVS